MASNSICTSCSRAIRLQSLKERSQFKRLLQISTPLIPTSRYPATPFSTSSRLSRDQPPPPPRPVQKPPEPQQPTTKSQRDAISNFAQQIRQRESFKSTTEPYIAYGSTEDLFRECNKQCDYTVPSRNVQPPPEEFPKNKAGEDIGEGEGWWYVPKDQGGLGLDVTFNTWAQVMYLHMYMLTVRLRCFPAKHAKIWHQNLLDHFFYAAEDRMAMWHGMSSRSVRNKYLKDLWQQWRGVLLSYDEGLIKGDAVLAAAIWRNVFKANVGTDIRDLALVTAYMRSQLQSLDATSDDSIAAGDVKFGDPRSLTSLAEKESPQMKFRVSPEELEAVTAAKTA